MPDPVMLNLIQHFVTNRESLASVHHFNKTPNITSKTMDTNVKKENRQMPAGGGEIVPFAGDSITKTNASDVSQEQIQARIYTIRGEQVMLDRDLAMFYGVETKYINRSVKRNPTRFPEDFCFQLTKNEWESLRSQNATLEQGRGQHTKYLPYAFTEPGVGQLSSVLKSKTADEIAPAPSPQAIFATGCVWNAHTYISELIRSAKARIILIDNFCDERTLMLPSSRCLRASSSLWRQSRQML